MSSNQTKMGSVKSMKYIFLYAFNYKFMILLEKKV